MTEQTNAEPSIFRADIDSIAGHLLKVTHWGVGQDRGKV